MFFDWIIDQLNQLTAISRPTNVAERKAIQHTYATFKTIKLNIF